MQRTIIIEDELNSQALLTSIIAEYCPTLSLVGTATNIKDGIAVINNLDPDLVFFDVELGLETSFVILDQLQTRNFKIVFTTAHDKYALKAFQYEAIEYILKPYTPQDVIKAVYKVKNATRIEAIYKQFENLHEHKNETSSRISIPTQDGVTLIQAQDIKRVKADKSYCKIFLKDDTSLFVTKPLGKIASLLPQSKFFRTHTSHLINLDYIKKFIKEDGGYILMTDEVQIPIARRRKSKFLSLI